MFGYVLPSKGQLKVCEYELYKAIYCGLCEQLGASFGPFARFTLSYDFVFLALLDLAIAPEAEPAFIPKRCVVTPLRRVPRCQSCPSLEYAGGVAMMLFYYKVLDNLMDEAFGKRMLWLLCKPFAKSAHNKAAAAYPNAARIIYDAVSRQSALEAERCDSVDAAAEPTAAALAGVCGLLARDERQRRVLERFGYLLGRYVYFCDALDDLSKDQEQGNYNPFLLRAGAPPQTPDDFAQIRQEAKGTLYLTLGELDKTYSLLKLYRYQPILDNIVHLGLQETVDRILLPKETKDHD